MELNDALIITGLGISVVFIGLILTNLMINSFTAIPKFLGLFKKKDSQLAETVEKPVETAVDATVDPDVIAVITAVLEVEFKKLSLLEGKFTFK
ncbi:MAG: OadG family protein [bacterium]|nr:OadG family protein [bacterium]